jgi:hypothetical protein
MKAAEVVTSHLVDASQPALESPSDEDMFPRDESSAAASTMLTVPCWWSWKAAMLMRAPSAM